MVLPPKKGFVPIGTNGPRSQNNYDAQETLARMCPEERLHKAREERKCMHNTHMTFCTWIIHTYICTYVIYMCRR
jgi:hypothetical protein